MKKSFLFVVIIALFFLISSFGLAYENEIQSLTGDLAKKITNSKKKVIAVVDFTDLKGNITELGRFLAEELSISLAASDNGFEVVDRNHLKSLLQEYKLSMSGLIDLKTTQKIGQISGTDALVTGTVTLFESSIRLGVKVLDTKTAKIITAATINIAKTKDLDDMMKNKIQSSISTPTPTLLNQKSVLQTVYVDYLTFDFNNYQISGRTIICNLTITNNSKGKSHIGIGSAMLYDNEGNEYSASRIIIGNKLGGTDLIPGISTKFQLTYTGINSGITKVSALKISIFYGILGFPDDVLFQNL
jgi:TolB-like protein